MESPITKEVISRAVELRKEDEHPLMKNGPIFEWTLGNIIIYEKYHEEFFNYLLYDLQYHHNNDDGSGYVPAKSDDNGYIIV